MKNLEMRIADGVDRKIANAVKDIVGLCGAEGRVTSTPLRGCRENEEAQKDISVSYNPFRNDMDKLRDKGAVKKKTSRNRRHERLWKSRISKSKDSLYSSSESQAGRNLVDTTSSESNSEEDKKVHRSILIREVPPISKFNPYGARDIESFFVEYENYCLEKYGDNRRFWVKGLGEFLEGRLADLYRAMVSVGEPKYEVVKGRVIEQVRRVKGGVKYRKRNDFEDAKMEKNEGIDMYAHRLETLARKKFGDEGIYENKELVRKFLATVPSYVAETVNVRRKEKMRWKKERLMWDDVLEMIEDREFENDRGKEDKDVWTGRMDSKSGVSYRDAVVMNTAEVMTRFLENYESERERRKNERDVYVGNGQRGRDERRNGNGLRGRSTSQNRNERLGENRRSSSREAKCFRCNKTGHVKRECRWTIGACFGCGKVGHLIKNCQNSESMKCFKCGGVGHRADECSSKKGLGLACGNCGDPNHYARMCEAPRSECTKCGKVGHLASWCRSKVRTEGSQGNGE